MTSASASTSRPSPAWLVLPVIGLGIIVSVVSVYYTTRPDAHTVSQVHREVRSILLHRSTKPGVEDGGAIGPWWVAATDVDELTGEFHQFRLRSGPVHLAAQTAMLQVSPEANAISFELEGVVLTVAPGSDEPGPTVPSLVELDRYVLGPAPYQRPIISDGSGVLDSTSIRLAEGGGGR